MSLYLARSSPSVQGPVILRPDIDIEPGLRGLCDFILVRCLVTCETYRREILCIFICIFFFLLEKSRNKRLEINIDRKVTILIIKISILLIIIDDILDWNFSRFPQLLRCCIITSTFINSIRGGYIRDCFIVLWSPCVADSLLFQKVIISGIRWHGWLRGSQQIFADQADTFNATSSIVLVDDPI